MSTSRYTFLKKIDGGRAYGSNTISANIRAGIESGAISFRTVLLSESERLDTIAGSAYGDASLWWIISAASGIGWGLQVPAGTIITIPDRPGDVYAYIG
jgi:hypothetical protein